ncbi:MAG: YibE/F family protein [Spirochaetes bacterium]|nr:YibE/F family protein [Spirochaetota bacterium]
MNDNASGKRIKAPKVMRSRAMLAIAALAAAFLMAAAGTSHARERKAYVDERHYARAKVERIERRTGHGGEPSQVEIKVHLRILGGEKKGQTHVASYFGEDDMPAGMFYREGDTVFIGISKMEGVDAVEYVSIYDVDNTAGIIVLAVLLILTIVIVGRLRGVLSMISLVATVILVFYILIPLTLEGRSPLPIAVVIALFSIVVTIPILLGFRKKTAAAILGASSGVLLATGLALFSGWIMHLSGIVTNEMMTVFYASAIDVDLRGLALAGIVIAALGAIMDVCISIASATEEIFRVHPQISVGEAFRSVFNVSSDILGATVNTLLFAYVGSALPMVLLIGMRIDPSMPFWLVFNYNPVLSELVKSAVGCIGMFLSMPVTAIICIEIHKRNRASA